MLLLGQALDGFHKRGRQRDRGHRFTVRHGCAPRVAECLYRKKTAHGTVCRQGRASPFGPLAKLPGRAARSAVEPYNPVCTIRVQFPHHEVADALRGARESI